MPRKKEIESKFSVDSPDAVRFKLNVAKSDCIGSGPERNIYFERLKGRKLSADKKVLRLRSWYGKNFLTYKRSLKDNDEISLRDEAETVVTDFKVMCDILRELGFYPHLEYVKDREVWLLHGTIVSLDKIEDGRMFVEVELMRGYSRRELLWVVNFLGLDWKRVEKRSYPEIIEEIRGGE